MENEMIERVARALETARFGDDCCSASDCARAAITAMREPTDAMVEAFWSADQGLHTPYDGPEPGDAWRAMIDTALAEPPPPKLLTPVSTPFLEAIKRGEIEPG